MPRRIGETGGRSSRTGAHGWPRRPFLAKVTPPHAPKGPSLRAVVLLLPGLALVVPAPPAGAEENDVTFYVEAGAGIPTDPPEFGDFWNTSLSLGGGFGARFSPLWEIAGMLHYQKFPADEQAQIDDLLLSGPGGVLQVARIDGRDATVLTVTAEARFLVPTEGRVLPYLAFGWGLFEIFTSDAVVTPTDPTVGPITVLGDTDGAFGATIGGGLQIPFRGNTRVTVDMIYTVGFTEKISTQYLPLRVGLGFGL